MDGETPFWLALNRNEGLSPRRKLALLRRFGHRPSALFEAANVGQLPQGLSNLGSASLRQPDWLGVEKDLEWLDQESHHLLTLGESDFPATLAAIDDPPVVLFVSGNPTVLLRPQVAVVGSRSASATGLRTARDLGRALGTIGIPVTSGLARGVDAAAHAGVLQVQGLCVGVAAHGLDSAYPRRNWRLFEEVACAGALVSEFPIGVSVKRRHFPQRNRLVCGLALGVVVVEAALRSGSLITAGLAAEQGREVFAVPGPINNPYSRGCHQLIKDGAKLVEGVVDVLEEFPCFEQLAAKCPALGSAPRHPPATAASMDAEARRVLDCLDFAPISMNEVVVRSGLTADVVSSILLALEIEGQVSSEPGLRYARATEA